jgi:hypothetical protein
MSTLDYKTLALRLYAHAKFAEDSDRYLDAYWQDVDAIGAELGVADIENPEDLGIPWPPTATLQCERPASYELLTHDHPATDRAMDTEYQHHIRHTHADMETSSWCGQQLSRSDWTFQNIDHAIYAIQQDTLQQPCPECLAVIRKTLSQ